MYSPLSRRLVKSQIFFLKLTWFLVAGLILILLLIAYFMRGGEAGSVGLGFLLGGFFLSMISYYLAMSFPARFEKSQMRKLARQQVKGDVTPPPLIPGVMKDDFLKMNYPEQCLFYLIHAIFLGRVSSYLLASVPVVYAFRVAALSQKFQIVVLAAVLSMVTLWFNRPQNEKNFTKRWQRVSEKMGV